MVVTVPYLAAGTQTLTLTLSPLDVALLVIYFIFVIGIGFALRRLITTSTDFFLSGRSLPAWVTGIAFIGANLGAIEILGMAASGAQYGISIVHYYWIGAIPAMVFLGIIMMPFYYGSKVRSVPEYLVRRYDPKTHLVNAIIFVLSSILIAGVNLFALASVLEALLGIPLAVAIVVSALFVLSYILLGGLTSAIYNEVMQFFVICAGLIPVVVVALKQVGGVSGLFQKLSTKGEAFTHPWVGLGPGGGNPIGDWIGLVLGLSFCLSFGYWTTNFAEVQRAMSAKDDNAARLTPIVGAFPKIIIPMAIVIPGMAAVLLIPGLGESGGLPFNDAIPGLMNKYLPTGVLGVAITGLLAAFMAGMAANVSSFNAVWTYDIWQNYIRPGRPDAYYLRVGRYTTIGGVLIGILTAFLAAGYSNINNYFQTLFSFFNVPIFLAFIVGMFWRKAGRGSGFWGMLVGTLTSFTVFLLYKAGAIPFRSDLGENQWAAIISFVVGLIAMVIATRFSEPRPEAELEGLVYGMQRSAAAPEPERVPVLAGAAAAEPRRGAQGAGAGSAGREVPARSGPAPLLKNPVALGMLALAFCVVMYVYIEIVNP
jgi:SSS family solute:Na+ symporter